MHVFWPFFSFSLTHLMSLTNNIFVKFLIFYWPLMQEERKSRRDLGVLMVGHLLIPNTRVQYVWVTLTTSPWQTRVFTNSALRACWSGVRYFFLLNIRTKICHDNYSYRSEISLEQLILCFSPCNFYVFILWNCLCTQSCISYLLLKFCMHKEFYLKFNLKVSLCLTDIRYICFFLNQHVWRIQNA